MIQMVIFLMMSQNVEHDKTTFVLLERTFEVRINITKHIHDESNKRTKKMQELPEKYFGNQFFIFSLINSNKNLKI